MQVGVYQKSEMKTDQHENRAHLAFLVPYQGMVTIVLTCPGTPANAQSLALILQTDDLG